MAKLITAKQASALSRLNHSIDRVIEQVNSQIRFCIQHGDYMVLITLRHPQEVIDTVVRMLEENGYEVSYTEVAENFAKIKVSWF